MGILDNLRTKRERQPVEALAILKPENPVNYDSVLDYLAGLSEEDYKKITKVTGIYREANRKAATVLDVEDQPTSALVEPKPSEDEIDQALDSMLDEPDLATAFLEDDEQPEPAPKKAQAPSASTKVTVSEE